MRNAFIDEIVQQAAIHPQIALIVGDLGYSVIEPFVDRYPDRFINAGVAEQNMAGLAAGMASEGYHVFAYSIANFPTSRCFEQIRNDIAYQEMPVTVVAVGGGLAYGSLGYSHHAVQDYALMRTMPGMRIAAPGDPFEVRACLRYLIDNPQPSYLRLGKAGEPNINRKIPDIKPGRWNTVVEKNSGKVILTTGATLEIGLEYLKSKEYSEYQLSSLPIWSMLDKDSQFHELEKYEKIITIEDHLIDGGFGSWLLEARLKSKLKTVEIDTIALNPKVCGAVGTQKYLNKLGGLYPE